MSDFIFDRSASITDFNANLKWADADFFETYGIRFVAGRPYQHSDTVRAFVVNETLVRKLRLHSPQEILGKHPPVLERAALRASGRRCEGLSTGSAAAVPLRLSSSAVGKNTYQLINIKLRPGPPCADARGN